MKLHGFKKYIVALSLLGFCSSGWAVIYPTPSLPGGAQVEDDDGSEYFALGDSIWTFELLDRGEVSPLSDFIEFEFGYYFESDADDGTVDAFFPIFGKNEATNLKTNVNIGSTDPIGFYLQSDAADLPDPLPDIPATILFTEADLNTPPPGQTETDWAGTYPVIEAFAPITTDFYLLAFFYPVPLETDGVRVIPIYASVAGPSPIPLPGAIFLWLTGLAGLALFRRSLGAQRPVTAAR